ncbi:MAG: hypothetical protein FWC61_00830 [Proteobacteria bacterium]|nr:hypothetical protein [Pseudomonadota bacterium]
MAVNWFDYGREMGKATNEKSRWEIIKQYAPEMDNGSYTTKLLRDIVRNAPSEKEAMKYINEYAAKFPEDTRGLMNLLVELEADLGGTSRPKFGQVYADVQDNADKRTIIARRVRDRLIDIMPESAHYKEGGEKESRYTLANSKLKKMAKMSPVVYTDPKKKAKFDEQKLLSEKLYRDWVYGDK